MTEVQSNGFTALTQDEMESIDGGIGIAAACLIIAGVIFLAGVATGMLESAC